MRTRFLLLTLALLAFLLGPSSWHGPLSPTVSAQNTALNRTTAALLTNKSGGAVTYGDVVILDNTNAKGFTTTTTGALSTRGIGVVLEPNGIANNASGMVAVGGWIPKVNLNTAATVGQFLKTHTVAGQATPHSSPQVEGDFGVALQASATPEAILFGAANAPGLATAPGGSTTQVQYNNAGAFGGISGATTNGTALTLVAPVLGTPASVTLTNATGLPTAGLIDDAVTYAKIQNVSATDRFLGRDTAGAGDVEEITASAARTILFSGALVNKSADQTAANYTTGATVAWDAEEYDSDGFHDTVTNNTRLTVPSGATKVLVHASIRATSVATSEWIQLVIAKNGSADYRGVGAGVFFIDSLTAATMSVSTAVLAVTAGDYFELSLTTESDTSITVEQERSSFGITVVQ